MLAGKLGAVIRGLREESKISLRGLAAKLKISPAHLSDIEKGKRYPSRNLMTRIANALGTTVTELRRFDSRIDPDVRHWAEGYPAVREMLEVLRDSGEDPNKLAKKIIDQVKGVKYKMGKDGTSVLDE